MKANAPEKIYLQVCGDCPQTDCDSYKFEDLEDNITWCKDKIFKKDIEYTRTDAFIEKACKYISEHIEYYMKKDKMCNIPLCPLFATKSFIEDFKIYMKGE